VAGAENRPRVFLARSRVPSTALATPGGRTRPIPVLAFLAARSALASIVTASPAVAGATSQDFAQKALRPDPITGRARADGRFTRISARASPVTCTATVGPVLTLKVVAGARDHQAALQAARRAQPTRLVQVAGHITPDSAPNLRAACFTIASTARSSLAVVGAKDRQAVRLVISLGQPTGHVPVAGATTQTNVQASRVTSLTTVLSARWYLTAVGVEAHQVVSMVVL
jgi:hypothetical protein